MVGNWPFRSRYTSQTAPGNPSVTATLNALLQWVTDILLFLSIGENFFWKLDQAYSLPMNPMHMLYRLSHGSLAQGSLTVRNRQWIVTGRNISKTVVLKHGGSEESHGACLQENAQGLSYMISVGSSTMNHRKWGGHRKTWEIWAADSEGTGNHLSWESSCHWNVLTLSPGRVFFLAQCTSTAFQGKMQFPSHISGRIITANRWNLCCADLWNIRWCRKLLS